MHPIHPTHRKALVLYSILLLIVPFFCNAVDPFPEKEMHAHYINVGQGAATLLEFPCGAILIDAGGQDKKSSKHLLQYLKAFFERRSDLHNTIDLIIITHCHKDHNLALKDVVNTYTVNAYIDNGMTKGSGKGPQNWARKTFKAAHKTYAGYTYDEVISQGHHHGLTNSKIDPLACSEVDPVVEIYSSGYPTQPTDWTKDDYTNWNNHSIVIKVTFGSKKLLFVGDMEEKGMETVLNDYHTNSAPAAGNDLDADVLLVSHHGSYNGTSQAFLDAVTPDMAIISVGKYSYGKKGENAPYNTWSYAHPRQVVLDLLTNSISGKRSTPINVKAGQKPRIFTDYEVTKKIYATAWDGDIELKIPSAGNKKIELITTP